MPGTFNGIQLAGNALRAFQYGMNVVGHNMANVNTAGYSRQAVDYTSPEPVSAWFGGRGFQFGQGVTLASINRIRDGFLDARMVETEGGRSRFDTLAAAVRQAEGVFNEPGPTGISAALDRFFNSWSALASNPGEAAHRQAVQQAGSTLAARVRGAYSGLSRQAADALTRIDQTIAQIDRITGTIAQLNASIRENVAAGGAPNDLLDQRNRLVEELSSLVNVNTTTGANGDLYVHFGGLPLVDTGGARSFPSGAKDLANYRVGDGTYTYEVRSGALYGLFEAANRINEYRASLDALADTLRAEVNAIHRGGIAPSGATNVAFFQENPAPPQNGAIDFALDPAVAADPANIVSSVTGVAGDGGLALSIAGLRNAASPLLGSKTYSAWYADFIAGVGQDVATAEDGLATQEALAGQVERQRQAVSGVSLDDEMANMMRLQKSYQAAARILSVMDQMTEEVIALVR